MRKYAFYIINGWSVKLCSHVVYVLNISSVSIIEYLVGMSFNENAVAKGFNDNIHWAMVHFGFIWLSFVWSGLAWQKPSYKTSKDIK